MPEWEKWAAFKTFGEPPLEAALRSTAEFLMEIKSGGTPRWLTLCGHSGTGKTHLLNKVFNWTGRRDWVNGKPGQDAFSNIVEPHQFVYWPRLANKLQNGESKDRYDDLWDQPIAFFDDIGHAYDSTGFVTGKLSMLLSARIDKWTMITANLSVQEIAERIDHRVASRIIRGRNVVVEVEAVDYASRREGA